MPDAPFLIAFDAGLHDGLRRRLGAVRWSDAVTADWPYGMDRTVLQALIRHWHADYDFDAAEQRLNALPQFRAQVGGFGVHPVACRDAARARSS